MLTPSQQAAVREMYDNGWNVEDIADELSLSDLDVLVYVDEFEEEQEV